MSICSFYTMFLSGFVSFIVKCNYWEASFQIFQTLLLKIWPCWPILCQKDPSVTVTMGQPFELFSYINTRMDATNCDSNNSQCTQKTINTVANDHYCILRAFAIFFCGHVGFSTYLLRAFCLFLSSTDCIGKTTCWIWIKILLAEPLCFVTLRISANTIGSTRFWVPDSNVRRYSSCHILYKTSLFILSSEEAITFDFYRSVWTATHCVPSKRETNFFSIFLIQVPSDVWTHQKAVKLIETSKRCEHMTATQYFNDSRTCN